MQDTFNLIWSQPITAGERSKRGSALAESPIVLLAMLIFLAFPMVNLGAIGYRTYFIIASTKEAAHKASRALTYAQPAQDNTFANNVPAVKVAEETVRRYLNAFNGVRINKIRTGIVVINNVTGQKSGPFYQPVSSVDVQNTVSYIEVHVEGEAVPMITYLGGLLGPIPGITSPVKISTNAREVFENPKGLMM
ncbi:MAG TPA: hypothetical protein V6D17_03930 [Candidatus Obscuribacterales bacterium]